MREGDEEMDVDDIGDKILFAGMGVAFACLGICAVIATLSEVGCL